MNHRLLSILTITLGASLAAQGGTVPPGYDSTESAGTSAYSYLLTYYQETHAQISNADLTGKGVKTMKEISFRQDGSTYSSTAVGRSWADVQLNMAETNYAALSTTYTANFLTTPTLVSSGSHTWPALNTAPGGGPKPWDNGGLKFPFSTQYIYSGTNDLLLDFLFTGGKLDNGGAWGPTSTSPNASYIDGRSVVTSAGGSLSSGGLNIQTNPCAKDSSYTGTSTSGPNSYFWHWSYAKVTGSPTTSDKMQYYFQLSGFPASIPVFQAVSLKGTTSQTNPSYPAIPGLGCQPLCIDVSQIFLVNAFTTNTSGSFNTNTANYINFLPGAVGLHIYTQSAWDDTVTKSTKLSRVSDTTIQVQPANADFQGKFAYNYNVASTTSFTASQSLVPLFRYQ